jgi:GT2 family glycosyltransferase
MLRVSEAGLQEVAIATIARPTIRGKFFWTGEEKLYLRGVTYGTFAPTEQGEFPSPSVVDDDFRAMAAVGINCVRTYTTPSRWILDLAQQHGLYVLAGIAWTQHVAFLDNERLRRDIIESVRSEIASIRGHPALLAYAIGNEIPAPIVRWHGRKAIEKFIRLLYDLAKRTDPGCSVTYVNYPTTEYLKLDFLDFVCFNVYLEEEAALRSYLARLQNIAGDRPLVLAEIGLDSHRNGLDRQAHSLRWQVSTAFASGCAGAFVFAWTDEWHRGGFDISDWDFGLVSRDRQPKPALAAVKDAFAELPFPDDGDWPRISVVVCSYNGQRTIRDCLDGLARLEYPNYEVIVVNDGSTDSTAVIASEYNVQLITTENRGLSNARNTGLAAATGEIVAYTDDDARPDPHWLTYLAVAFRSSDHAGIGGPNIAPAGDGLIADCVANAPGGPVHVLLDDTTAEHIPGCNMAFRKDRLLAIGGFDSRYRAAGDDVDVCWRLQEQGWTLGFCAAATVWHHRRNSVRTYWKQQVGYGRAEALLEAKWPEKYNSLGHTTWAGRLYGKGLTKVLSVAPARVYSGPWGMASYQSVYEPRSGGLLALSLMPEWYFLVAALACVSLGSVLWTPLLAALIPFSITAMLPLLQAWLSARRASFTTTGLSAAGRLRLRVLTGCLHLMQPLARLRGRLKWGLSPLRGRVHDFMWPRPLQVSIWREKWQSPSERAEVIGKTLKTQGLAWLATENADAWDLRVSTGVLGGARLRLAVEEHEAGRQQLLAGVHPDFSPGGIAVVGLLAFLSLLAFFDGAVVAGGILAGVAFAALARMVLECGRAVRVLKEAFHVAASL